MPLQAKVRAAFIYGGAFILIFTGPWCPWA